jgi:hypothetical protein
MTKIGEKEMNKRVYDNAVVYGNARVYGNAKVSDNAIMKTRIWQVTAHVRKDGAIGIFSDETFDVEVEYSTPIGAFAAISALREQHGMETSHIVSIRVA